MRSVISNEAPAQYLSVFKLIDIIYPLIAKINSAVLRISEFHLSLGISGQLSIKVLFLLCISTIFPLVSSWGVHKDFSHGLLRPNLTTRPAMKHERENQASDSKGSPACKKKKEKKKRNVVAKGFDTPFMGQG